MRQRRTTLDRIATLAALRLLAWIGKRVDPDQQLWLEALRAELDAIDGGIARLVWAVGGLRLIWFERRQHMVNATYRYGPVLLNVLGLALLIGLTWSLIQHYGSIAVIFFELTGCALVLALPMAIGLVHAIRSEAGYKEPERRVRPLLLPVLGVLSLATLLVLGLSAPLTLQSGYPTADHHTAEAALDQTVGTSHYEAYLTTQVKPLAVNGMPLAQVFLSRQSPLERAQDLQALINKFTGIQGYDLAHGQFPDGSGMGFASEWGSNGSGPDQIVGPPGRLLDAHDVGTLNVLIPLEEIDSYSTYNGSTITVQSLITGQTLDLHVVGQFDTSDGTQTPLFGQIIADDSVVQTLSGGHPSYTYSLDLNMNQRQAVFERLHTSVPTAQIYDFTTETSNSKFIDPYPANIWDYKPYTPDPPLILGAIAIVWAGLLAILIALNWEYGALWKRRSAPAHPESP